LYNFVLGGWLFRNVQHWSEHMVREIKSLSTTVHNLLHVRLYSLCPVQPPNALDDEEMTTRELGSKISWPLKGNTTSHTSTPAAGITTGTKVSFWNTATSTGVGTRPAPQFWGDSKSTSGVHCLATASTAPPANDLYLVVF